MNIEKLKIIAKIEEFLNAAESLEDLHILQDTSSITISSKIDVLDDEKIKHEIISTNLMHSLKQKNPEGPEIIKEVHQENLEFSSSAAECFEMIEEESPEVDDDNFDDEATESDPESHEDFLTSEQLNWIRDELETSQIKHGRKTMFRCSVCFKLVSSSDYLSTHLKEIHIVEESEVEKSMGFKQCENFLAEIASSRFLLLTKSGQEHFWKCRRCKKTFKSEHSFRFHLRSKHLNEFSKAEVEFAVEIAEPSDKFYLEEVMVEEHLEDEGPVPKKRKLNTLEDLTEEQIAWLRKNVAAGEMIEDNVKIFKCVICNQVLSTQASLIRHVRDVHVMKNSERDEKNIVKGEVGSSRLEIKTSLGVETIWKCKRCESERIYKSEQSFKIHLRMKHLRVTKVETAFVAACKTQIFEGKVTKEVWRCPDCARIFRHRDSLRNHIKLEHPNMDEEAARKKMLDEPPIDVEENGKAMTRIIQKLEHKTVGKSLSFCHECGIKFETSKHHNKPKVHQDCHDSFKILAPHFPRFRCDDCRVIFNSEESLAHHTNLHGSSDIVHLIPAEGLATFGSKYYKDPIGDADDAVDEAVCWKCAHCPVRYFDENDCLNHILMMHSTSIFCCIDNREFFGSGGLGKFNQHMKNKHPELFPDLKYPCSGCQEEFSSVYEKLAHQKNCKSKKFGCDYCGELRMM